MRIDSAMRDEAHDGVDSQRAVALVDAISGGARAAAAADARRVAQMIELQDLRRVEGQRCLGGAVAGDLEAELAVHELSLALTIPAATVCNELARGRRLRSRLTSVWQAWLAGSVSTAKTVAIDRALRRLQEQRSISLLNGVVVPIAERRTVPQLRAWLDRFVVRAEPDQAAKRQRRAAADRAVWFTSGEDGMAWMNAYLSAADAAQIDDLLERSARDPGTGDPRTVDQRRADTLVDLLLQPSAAGDGGACATIGVVVPIQSLTGESDAPGELADRSQQVPIDVIRDRAVRPGTLFWRLLTDERGTLLDATQLGRFASDNLGFVVRMRDGTSVFPTSTVPAARCDLDHTYAHCSDRQCDDLEHGPTTAANLGPLHRRVHNLKTAGLLRVRQPEPGTFVWTTPTGHRYTRQAEPLPVQQWLSRSDLPAAHPDRYQWPDQLDSDDPALDTYWDSAA